MAPKTVSVSIVPLPPLPYVAAPSATTSASLAEFSDDAQALSCHLLSEIALFCRFVSDASAAV